MSADRTHTPGPWEIAKSPSFYAPELYEIHWSEIGECVAEIVHGKANAHLIAAAPELLAACEQALDELEDFYEQKNWVIKNYVDYLKAAIAKAKGAT